MRKNTIKIIGARENNLKNISIEIPKNKLVVFTGVSGSGKSSLAFNTIYEEGRRRYVDSLSAYARQFLGGTSKPLVESIDGLSPAISIEQKTTHTNPRSTVGTITEIYDYLRLLFARVGTAYCPNHKTPIEPQSTDTIIESVYKNKIGTKLNIMAPIVQGKKGSFEHLFDSLRKDGFIRVKVDGEQRLLEEEIILSKNHKHHIQIIVDRVVLKDEVRSRISEAISLAGEYANGMILIDFDGVEKLYSKNNSCKLGDFDMPNIEPRLFSFNSPHGMCEKCKGLGIQMKMDPKKLIPDDRLSIKQGALSTLKNAKETNIDRQEIFALCDAYGIPTDLPIRKLKKSEVNIILNGSDREITRTIKTSTGNMLRRTSIIEGIATKAERRYLGSNSEMVRSWYKTTYMSDSTCDECKGKRLNKFALSVKINNNDVYEITKLSIEEAVNFITNVTLTSSQKKIAEIIIAELFDRLSFLENVGLNYLTLDRAAGTLSGGESQRIKLATQVGSNLTGVLYILDEPSIGLHQADNAKLINTLKKMVDIGNTLIVVEHDEETMSHADYLVEIGPEAGKAGGEIVFAGTLEEMKKSRKSITGKFLSGRETIDMPKSRRTGSKKVVEIKGASANNLHDIDVKIPLGKFVAVTGVSGSGKSTLVNEVIKKAITQKISNPFIVPGEFESIKGYENVDKIVSISQSPIGRTPKSNPATYTSVFDDIRDIYAGTLLSQQRGYKKGNFSFNVDGGRCEKCRGDGVMKIEMHFLPNVYIDCDVCDGKRYKSETLEVKFKGKSIYDVLEMSVEEAYNFFINNKRIKIKLLTLKDVGLGYIKLGQRATTLSGGEAQRVKLATYLQKKPTGRTLFILDEPTTGLHNYDVRNLLTVLNRIVDNGDTVLVIEHNLDVIKCADYIIDLGPEGGVNGGRVIAKGTPEQVASVKSSATGKYLIDIINK